MANATHKTTTKMANAAHIDNDDMFPFTKVMFT